MNSDVPYCRELPDQTDLARSDSAQSGQSMALLRLLQISSPQLPVGAYTFSQGLEWAVHAAWVTTVEEFERWLREQLHGPVENQEIPILGRLLDACIQDDQATACYWGQFALACRETHEFREEERNRAKALYRVLESLSIKGTKQWKSILQLTPLAGMAFAAARWAIPRQDLLQAHAFTWLENQITAGIKLIPLGQSSGQQLLFTLADTIPDIVTQAELLGDAEIGYSCVSITEAGCRHETQYSRLYQS